MITVSILINGQPIFTRSAVNKGMVASQVEHKYLLDDGTTLIHKREDGAVKLAIQMLKTIKEQKVAKPCGSK